MSNEPNQWMNDEIDRIFAGQPTIDREKLKQTLEAYQKGRGGGGGRGGRGGMDQSGSMHDEMKQKLSTLLDAELDKINSDKITKEQAKAALTSFGSQAKEQCRVQKDQQMQCNINDELTKLNVKEVNATQARDLLRKVGQKVRPPHGGGPTMLDDNMKHDFLNEFKTKHGTNKISADEAWDLIKNFDKKQHDKMGCCERSSEWEKDKDKRWEDTFNEQYKELYGDINKTKIDQQQLEDLAKKIKDKLRSDCPQQAGKRFCQH